MPWQLRAPRRWTIVTLITAGACALLIAALAFAQDMDEHAPSEVGESPTKTAGCPNLSEALWWVAQSPDWVTAAESVGAQIVDGRVRVIVELATDQEPPTEMPGIVEGQYQQFVQVLLEPSELCSLASTPGVVAVNPPFPAAPAAPVRPSLP